MTRALLSLSVALLSFPAFAGEAVSIRLNGQLWSRPVGAENRLKFKTLAEPTPIAVGLDPSNQVSIGKLAVPGERGSAKIVAHGTAILVPAKGARPPFVAFQSQLIDSELGLVAECSSYFSVTEASIGVGVCSGVRDGVQYGVSYSAPQP